MTDNDLKKSESKGKDPEPRANLEPPSFPIVGVGASAGGLEAFSELLRHLPVKTGMAFVLVQHLDPKHGSVLQEILSRTTKIPVEEVTDGAVVQPDRVYVIPANANMAIQNGVLQLAARVLTRGQHMPIDHFLRSLAEDRGHRAIGVILSGTASDGTEGVRAIKAAGGITFAQDDESAKYNSMPRSAVSAGCIDFILSPKAIARELAQIGRHPYLTHAPARKKEPLPLEAASELSTVFSILREATGVDFTHYKQSTLQRRINRRMVLHKLDDVKDYVNFVKKTPSELDELYRDILIHVTGFFRDPETFDALTSRVFPNLFQGRKADDPIRIWVPGCSTGEEAYSIAIVLLEYLWQNGRDIPLASVAAKAFQLFATDISDTSLDRARAGLYSASIVAEVSPERLKRFFMHLDGGYQINKSIREMCVFAKQNITKDPPFSNLDLISCRNLLIYLGPALQKRVIPTFHYALKPSGYLLLGGSETLGTFFEYFAMIDKKHKIYQKKKTDTRLLTYFAQPASPANKSAGLKNEQAPQTGFVLEKEVDRILFSKFVPASIVVNDDLEIVQFRGRTGPYLEPAPGHPTFNLSKMAREGLLIDLRAALAKARKENAAVRKERVCVRSDGGAREVNLEVVPIRGFSPQERYYVVVFQEPAAAKSKEHRKTPVQLRRATSRDNERLRRELTQIREQFQSLIEEHETTLEEFKSANEEVLSANEELQSTNEELETAKEELQSSNEELTTLNEELQNRNAELSLTNNDLLNLLGNVNIPVVMVSNDLRIRRFTPPTQKLLNLLPSDIGRRLGEVRPNLDLQDVEGLAREVVDTVTPQEREVRDEQGNWHLLRVRPYKTWDNKIDGAVISFQDINALKRSLNQIRDYADALIQNAREAILVLDSNLRVAVANEAFYQNFRVSPEETEDRPIYSLGEGQWNIPELRQLLAEILPRNTRIDDFEVSGGFPHIGPRTMLLNARRMEAEGGSQLILLAIEDITEKRQHEEALKRQALLLDLASDAILVREQNGKILFWNLGAERMYGWSKEEALGKTASELLHTDFPAPWEEIETALHREGRWEGELVHSGRDGKRMIVASRWALLQEPSQAGPLALEINTDITSQKQSEQTLHELSAYLLRLQDEERRRIARELHDSTGQKLAVLRMSLDSMGSMKSLEPKVRTGVSECLDLTQQMTEEIRTLAYLLHPPMLDEAGLVSAIRWYLDGFSRRAGVHVDFQVPPKFARLPENMEVALFRVVQECLTNVHLHSGAQKARIRLAKARNGDAVTLEVSDEGKGMPMDFVPGSKDTPPLGVGIAGMRERIAQLGGELEITSGETGTTVKAVVPVEAQAPKTAAGGAGGNS